MHESSLVRTLLEQVQQICRERCVRALRSIRISIGLFSGVEPLLVRSAFEDLQPDYFAPPVELQIDTVPLTAECRACTKHFEVVNFRFVCPHCQTTDVHIVSGDELRLVSLDGTMEDDKISSPDRVAPHSLSGSYR
ncbi:MAG: hydrogenase maturation nickel metallochaperone HypA [Planctomycetales bacterium]